MKTDVLIIGAGAAGLMAMQELLQAGRSVCLLEAAALPGGRIATLHEAGFDGPVEQGAEFVHGKLPLTLSLLNKAGIHYTPVEGSMISVQQGQWKKNEPHDPHWKMMMHQLAQLKTDMSISDFLDTWFAAEKYSRLRAAVQRFSEGFDLADTRKASALAALQEWGHEEETQYRLPGGYGQLVAYLLEKCQVPGGTIAYNSQAAEIEYTHDGVRVITTNRQEYTAATLIITASAGMLQSGQIIFNPALDTRYAGAIAQLGFGQVIKILLQFNHPFWNAHEAGIGFLLSDEAIPTWWTQLPEETNLLTGWLGGPAAVNAAGNESALLQSALKSLAGIFHTTAEKLQDQLQHYKICNWQQHRFAKGGYSYVTVESAAAKKILAHPVNGVIYFAGEAMHRGQSQGTVEAALQSGQHIAKIVQQKWS